MIFVKKHTTHAIRKDPVEVKYWVSVVRQPLRDKVWHEIYHWYDMRVPLKIPGFRHAFDRGVPFKHTPPEWRGSRIRASFWDRVTDWSVSQDFRCYQTSVKNTVVLAEFEVDEEVYNKI